VIVDAPPARGDKIDNPLAALGKLCA